MNLAGLSQTERKQALLNAHEVHWRYKTDIPGQVDLAYTHLSASDTRGSVGVSERQGQPPAGGDTATAFDF